MSDKATTLVALGVFAVPILAFCLWHMWGAMTRDRRQRLLIVLCVLLHIAILWNLWIANQHTPRIIQTAGCFR